jgi:hypothetical protein
LFAGKQQQEEERGARQMGDEVEDFIRKRQAARELFNNGAQAMEITAKMEQDAIERQERVAARLKEDEERKIQAQQAQEEQLRAYIAKICATQAPTGLPFLIPEEIWLHIFHKLMFRELAMMSLTCQTFKRIASDENVVSLLYHSKCISLIPLIQHPVRRYERVRRETQLRLYKVGTQLT